MPTKDQAAQELIEWHFSTDLGLIEVYRFVAEQEDDPQEPVKLLEVTTETLATGRVDTFSFGKTDTFPYLSMIATITPSEMDLVRSGDISLPPRWDFTSARRYAANVPANIN